MTAIDTLGYLASSLVLATFCTRTMVSLRALAIASNFAFIGYAASAHLWPILLLHTVMLPMNLNRLREALRHRREAEAAREPAAATASAPIAVRLRTIDRSRRTVSHIRLPVHDRLSSHRRTVFSSTRRHSMIAAAERLPYAGSSASGQRLQAAECGASMPL